MSSIQRLRDVRLDTAFHQTASVTRWDFGWRDRVDKLNERFFPVRHRICNADIIAEIKTDVQLYV
jgi:hypothetical protein